MRGSFPANADIVATAGSSLAGLDAVVAQRRVGGALFAALEQTRILDLMLKVAVQQKDVSHAFRTIATCGAILTSAVSHRYTLQGTDLRWTVSINVGMMHRPVLQALLLPR